MALIQCFSCGGKLSTKAEKCPHCGITALELKKKKEESLRDQAREAKKKVEKEKPIRSGSKESEHSSCLAFIGYCFAIWVGILIVVAALSLLL